MKLSALSGLICGILGTSFMLWLTYFQYDELPMISHLATVMFDGSMLEGLTQESIRIEKGEMAVITNAQGVALVDFLESTDNSAGYRWRYSSHFRKKVITGGGKVFEDSNLFRDNFEEWQERNELWVNAGPIRLEWSACSSTCSYLYYDPQLLKIELLPSDQFASYTFNVEKKE